MTAVVTLPVGFAFYLPDPALTAWRKEHAKLKKQGVAPKNRPPRPARHPADPTKQELALARLAAFRRAHPTIAVQLVLAEAFYGTPQFREQAATRFGTPVIRPLPTNQHVRFRHKLSSLEQYFTQSPGVPPRVRIRGGEEVTVLVSRARLSVDAHHKKRFVGALKYPDEMDYRSVVASDLSWRTLDIVQG